MTRMDSEKGRSLLETLAVLVVGISLLLAGLIGYDFGIDYWKRLKTVEEISEVVTMYDARRIGCPSDKETCDVDLKDVVPSMRLAGATTVVTTDGGRVQVQASTQSSMFLVKVSDVQWQSCRDFLENGDYDVALVDCDCYEGVYKDLGLEKCTDENKESGIKLAVGREVLKKMEPILKATIVSAVCGPNTRSGDDEVSNLNMAVAKGGNCSPVTNGYEQGGICLTCLPPKMRDPDGNCCDINSMNECGYCPESKKCTSKEDVCTRNIAGAVYVNACNDQTKQCVECMTGENCSNCGDQYKDTYCTNNHCCPKSLVWQNGGCVCANGGDPCGDSCCSSSESCVVRTLPGVTVQTCCTNDGSETSACNNEDNCCISGNCTNGHCCAAGKEYTTGDSKCCDKDNVYTDTADGNKVKCCPRRVVDNVCPPCDEDECLWDGKCYADGDDIEDCGTCNGGVIETKINGNVCQKCDTSTWVLVWKDSTKTYVVNDTTCCANDGTEKSVCGGDDCCTSSNCTNGHCCPAGKEYTAGDNECCDKDNVYTDTADNKVKCCPKPVVGGVCPVSCGEDECLWDGSCIPDGTVVPDADGCGKCNGTTGNIEQYTDGDVCHECNTTTWILQLIQSGYDKPCANSCCASSETCVERMDGNVTYKTCCANDGSEKSVCAEDECCTSSNCTNGHCCPAGKEYTAGDSTCCDKDNVYTDTADDNKVKCCPKPLVGGVCPVDCGEDECLWNGKCYSDGDNIEDCGLCKNGTIVARTGVELTACQYCTAETSWQVANYDNGTHIQDCGECDEGRVVPRDLSDDEVDVCHECNTTTWLLQLIQSGYDEVCGESCCGGNAPNCVEATTGEVSALTCCANDGTEKSVCAKDECCASGNCTNKHCCSAGKEYTSGDSTCCDADKVYTDSADNKVKCCPKPLEGGVCPVSCGEDECLWNEKCYKDGDNIEDCGLCKNGTIVARDLSDDEVDVCHECNTTTWVLVLKDSTKTHVVNDTTCCANDGSEESVCVGDDCCTSGNCTNGHCCPADTFWSDVAGRCVECLWDNGTNKDGACSSTSKPQCDNASPDSSWKCGPCPGNKPWWDTSKNPPKCVCRMNYDDDNEQKNGECPKDLPWCDTEDTSGPVCKECPQGTFWNSVAHRCTACTRDYDGSRGTGACESTQRPLCPTYGTNAWTCQPCPQRGQIWFEVSSGNWQCVNAGCTVGGTYGRLPTCKEGLPIGTICLSPSYGALNGSDKQYWATVKYGCEKFGGHLASQSEAETVCCSSYTNAEHSLITARLKSDNKHEVVRYDPVKCCWGNDRACDNDHNTMNPGDGTGTGWKKKIQGLCVIDGSDGSLATYTPTEVVLPKLPHK